MSDLTYKQLQKAVTDLGKSVTRDADTIRSKALDIKDQAQDTTRVAEMIGGMGVDPATIAETQELARILQGVSEAATSYASAGTTTAKLAAAASDQAKRSHGGIQEAVSSAPIDTRNVNSEWLRQE